MKYIITTKALTKKYKNKTVVDHLDLKVPKGSIYGFLGPNGAGKSTTMKMLLGLTKPSLGYMSIFEKEMTEKNRLDILKDTGSFIESPSYYGHLSGKENLQIICKLKNVPEHDINRVLKLVRMEKQQNKKVGQYSLGMKQRLALAAALLGTPKLLFLDEPTNGLDPSGILEMRELIRSLPEHGITVFLSSHLLSEIDQMATDIGIINNGKLIFQDTLLELHEQNGIKLFFKTQNDQAAWELLTLHHLPVRQEKNQICLHNFKEEEIIRAVKLCVKANIGVLRIEEEQRSLEDIFLNLTRKQVSL
ncbi:MAG: ABC transporter ATP-binding protein [Lachnospiraceae bacterium]